MGERTSARTVFVGLIVLLGSLAARCFNRPRRVCALPGNICRWSIGRGNVLTQQSQIHSELGAVMRGVEQPSPEYPDPLANDIEKLNLLQPPRLALPREECHARICQFLHSQPVILWALAGW